MKHGILTLFLMLCGINLIGQTEISKKEIRRTIGISFTPLPNAAMKMDYMQKFGIQYRQCFGATVFQGELNLLGQMDSPALQVLKHQYYIQGDSAIIRKTILYSQPHFNAQVTLSRGWTNDKINLYLGGGVFLDYSLARQHIYTYSYEYLQDSTGAWDQGALLNSTSTVNGVDYVGFGAVLKGGIEFKLYKKWTLLCQASPAWVYYTKLKDSSLTIDPNSFAKHYFRMSWSRLEIGIHYRIS